FLRHSTPDTFSFTLDPRLLGIDLAAHLTPETRNLITDYQYSFFPRHSPLAKVFLAKSRKAVYWTLVQYREVLRFLSIYSGGLRVPSPYSLAVKVATRGHPRRPADSSRFRCLLCLAVRCTVPVQASREARCRAANQQIRKNRN